MGRDIAMIRSTKGFYTLEATIFLPLVILAVLSLGYFIKVEGTWENVYHGAIDECSLSASKAYGSEPLSISSKIKNRVTSDNPDVKGVSVDKRSLTGIMSGDSHINAYSIRGELDLNFPLGFEYSFALNGGIKYRNFVGKTTSGTPLGSDGLSSDVSQEPVYVFPYSGEKYHGENCTYVKATATKQILNTSLKSRYSSCGLCHSGNASTGSIVYCFKSEDSAYHIGSCKSLNRRTMVIDKKEATKKGYTACSKCGGS
jgi:hypothetical protein